MGAYLRPGDAGHADARRVHVQRDLQVPGLPVRAARTCSPTRRSTDAYRGAGRPEATFAIERMMDELAAELGMDPLELREQNWIKHEEFPFTTVCRADLRLRQLRGRHRARPRSCSTTTSCAREQAASAASASDPVQLGIGISTFTEMCGLAPSRVLGALRLRRRRLGDARRSGCCPPARSRWSPASSAHGQGHETAWSQIVADQLGVPFEDVEVLHGDTQISPRGMDTYGSRSLVVGGDRRGQGRREGDREGQADRRAPARGVSVDDLEFAGGRFRVRGTDKGVAHPARSRSATFAAHNLPDGVEPAHRRRRHLRPGELLLPARHPPVRDGGRHRDRAGRRSARTSASTTSATSSTR